MAVTGVSKNFSGFPEGTRAIDYYPRSGGDTGGPQFGDEFFKTFGRSSRSTICACETETAPTISQALHLSVGDTVNSRLAAGGKIKSLIESGLTPTAILDELFIRTLSRRPTAKEQQQLLTLIATDKNNQHVYEDIFWGLLNSTEFTFNY